MTTPTVKSELRKALGQARGSGSIHQFAVLEELVKAVEALQAEVATLKAQVAEGPAELVRYR